MLRKKVVAVNGFYQKYCTFATDTAKDATSTTLTPTIYHNALKNSFADQDMYGWKQTNESPTNGLDMMVDADSDGNKFWRSSLKNTMTQTVSLSGNKGSSYRVAAIASINPHYGRSADVSVVATGPGMAETQLVVANLGTLGATDGWQTVFKMGEINAKATQLQFVVSAEAEDPNKKYSHEGPMFDDLCLLLSKDEKTIEDEDVLIFKMGSNDVTISYTPVAKQGTVSVSPTDHATLTLLNSNTLEEGTSVKAMENDVIVVKGTTDEGYAIYSMKCNKAAGGSNSGSDNLILDSISIATREVTYHYIMRDDKDASIAPVVEEQKVYVKNQYGALAFTGGADTPQFARVPAAETATMQPMSYCFTAYDARTFENLPLANDRIQIVVLDPEGIFTGIESLNTNNAMNNGNAYNLKGQKVDGNYRGIAIKNGRKVLKR